jgi:Transposase IS66 family
VCLIAAHAIPVHRCAEMIGALTGAQPSPGFVHAMIARAAAAVAQANAAIRCLIILAHVVSADETPIRAGPGPKDPQALPAGRLHAPAHLLLRQLDGWAQGVMAVIM